MASTRRRPSRSVQHTNLPDHSPGKGSHPKNQFIRAATGPTAKITYAVIGTVGLAALAVAIFGPRRFQQQIVTPVRNAVGDQAGHLWADSRPLRDQITQLFERAQNQTGREKLVRNFQSWIGHFKAS